MRRTRFVTIDPARQIVILASVACAVWYLHWRLSSFNQDALMFSWLVYGAEVFGFVTSLMHFFMVWRYPVRKSLPAPANATVDVLIPTINEHVDIVRRTLLAAQNIDYPHKTLLLDDGDRPELRALAESLGCQYLARPTHEHAKAGNLNYGLAHSDGEFIAIFDADHAPQRGFLTRTLGYFENPQVAFVQTPQDFFNLDSYQHRWRKGRHHVWTEQSLFFRVIQRGKDYWNAAFLCGSCAVLRRGALEDIGGFAVETVTEDLHTSLHLHMAGFDSVYHPESLAFGIAPAGVSPFLKQRMRWGRGAMNVWRKEGLLFNRRLTWPQRINYCASVLTYFDGWQKFIFYIAPVFVLFTGIMPIHVLDTEFFWHFIPYYVMTFFAFEEAGRGFGKSIIIEQYNMARFAAFAYSTLGLFSHTREFDVTEKKLARERGSYFAILPQIAILGFNVLAIPVGVLITVYNHWLPWGAVIANAFWASINALLAGAVVRFTLRQKHRRVEYRFPIALPAKINTRDGWEYATVDSLNSSGCRINGNVASRSAVGTQVSGELLLPSGKVPFLGTVCRSIVADKNGGEAAQAAIGCEFQWADETGKDLLELFLYGSDLQWHLHNLEERIPTPLEWIPRLLGNRKDEQRIRAEAWYPVVFEQTDHPHLLSDAVGLVSVDADENNYRDMLSFQPLEDGARVQAIMLGTSGPSKLTSPVQFRRSLESPISPLYLYRVGGESA